jgi:hypothetical protein
MSWGRFLVVALITSLLLLPVSALAAPVVADIGEPWKTIAIILAVVVAYFIVDRLFVALLRALDRGRRP